MDSGSTSVSVSVADRPAFRSSRAVAVLVGVFAVLLAADLALKHWAFNVWPAEPVDIDGALEFRRPLPGYSSLVVPDLLALKLTLNRGAVFGIAAGYRWFFIAATAAAVIVIGCVFAASRARQWWLHAALAMILAGAIGNLVDRVRYGAVRDMLWLFPGVELPFGWTWPGGARDVYPWIFNAADAFLLLGIAMMMLRTLFAADRPEPAEGRAGAEADAEAGPRS